MGTTVSDSGGDFTPPDAGTHIARCVRVIDLGTQEVGGQWPGAKPKVMLAWELPTSLHEWEGEQVPMLTHRRFTANLSEKANLRKILDSWRGRKFTPEELNGFQLEKVLGAPCMVTLVHSDDGKYANVVAVTAMPKGMEVPPQHHPSIHYEIESGASEVFSGFSDNLQATIRKSSDWEGGNEAPPGSEPDDPGFGDGDFGGEDPIPF